MEWVNRWITVARMHVECIFCPSQSNDYQSAAVEVGVHHRVVAPGATSVMDVTPGGLNRAGKDRSRMCRVTSKHQIIDGAMVAHCTYHGVIPSQGWWP